MICYCEGESEAMVDGWFVFTNVRLTSKPVVFLILDDGKSWLYEHKGS